ncbi:MAG: rhamnulokinase [Bacillota bacterium]
MNGKLNLAALDLGAESGRVILGRLEKDRFTLEETCRFPNEPVWMGRHLYWDLPRLVLEMKKGIKQAYQKAGHLDGVAIDTWGVDYGLLDGNGELMANPIHYRDHRTDYIATSVFAKVPAEEIFRRTGIQMMTINTIFQLAALHHDDPEMLDRTEDMLFIPGLLGYFLTGKKINDVTIASTAQLFDPSAWEWAWELADKLSLPRRIFKHVADPGTIVGGFAPEVAKELGFNSEVMTIGGHDTASAVAAVPAEEEHFIYISCGTWSLVGTELAGPLINSEAMRLNFSNEIGIERKIRFLKNVMGLWLLQQCRKDWSAQGREYDYGELTRMAAGEKPWRTIINPDDQSFLHPESMCEAIAAFARKTEQPVPETEGSFVRCIIESLALKYGWVIDYIEKLTGFPYHHIHMVGGGIKNEMLCQLTADITGRAVVAGPVEATAIGNILTQALALQAVKSLPELRRMVKKTFPPAVYQPAKQRDLDWIQNRFQTLLD